MATHSSFLAWEIPWTEEPGELLSMGSQIVGRNSTHTHTHTQSITVLITPRVPPPNTIAFEIRFLIYELGDGAHSDQSTPQSTGTNYETGEGTGRSQVPFKLLFKLLTLLNKPLWRRKWQPTPVFLPGESQGRGSLVGWRLWGRTESDTTEAT